MVILGRLLNKVLIPGAHGRAVFLRQGQYLKVIDVHGKQVCDFFAFNPADPTEFLSASHTRGGNNNLNLEVGKPLYNNDRQPVLLLEEDTVKVHDMRFAACDPTRYGSMYGKWQHRSCKMNLLEALEEFNLWPPVLPDPVNFFMNTPVDEKSTESILPPVSKAGDFVILRALRDLIVVGSACPMDLNPTNDFNPTDIMFEIYEATPE
ncbi:DUF1989 domain-containing protein [Chloroflexota bacterium]